MNIGDSKIISILNVLLDASDYISSVIIAEKIGASESTFFRLLPQAFFLTEKLRGHSMCKAILVRQQMCFAIFFIS